MFPSGSPLPNRPDLGIPLPPLPIRCAHPRKAHIPPALQYVCLHEDYIKDGESAGEISRYRREKQDFVGMIRNADDVRKQKKRYKQKAIPKENSSCPKACAEISRLLSKYEKSG